MVVFYEDLMAYINLKSPYQIYREDIRLLIEKKMNIWKKKPIHTLSLLSSHLRSVSKKQPHNET